MMMKMNETHLVKIGHLETIYSIVYYENKMKDFYFLGIRDKFIVFSLIIINLLIAVTGAPLTFYWSLLWPVKTHCFPRVLRSPPRMTVNRMSCKSKFSLKTFLLVTGSVMYQFQRLLSFEEVSYEVKFCISITNLSSRNIYIIRFLC